MKKWQQPDQKTPRGGWEKKRKNELINEKIPKLIRQRLSHITAVCKKDWGQTYLNLF